MTGELCSQPPLGVADTMFPNRSATSRWQVSPRDGRTSARVPCPVTSQAGRAAAPDSSAVGSAAATPAGAAPSGTRTSPVAYPGSRGCAPPGWPGRRSGDAEGPTRDLRASV